MASQISGRGPYIVIVARRFSTDAAILSAVSPITTIALARLAIAAPILSNETPLSDPPAISITNAVIAPLAIPTLNIYGTNNSYTVGSLWVSNSAVGGAESAFAWGDTITLVPGPNTISVYGTNVIGLLAFDSYQAAYHPPAYVDITNAAPQFTTVPTVNIYGTNNMYTVGSLSVLNASAGGAAPVSRRSPSSAVDFAGA